MREAQFQSAFSKWMRENPLNVSAAFELKIVKGNSIPFNAVQEHQITALREVQNGYYYKISDTPFNHSQGFRFHRPKPFDCFIILGRAYVVLLFYKPRRKMEAIFIDVNDWVTEQQTSTRKSLTEERALKIADMIQIL
jgi:hypothetical protein